MEKKHIIPRWLFYISVVIMSMGGAALITENLLWGRTLEENVGIGITFIFAGVFLFDRIGMLLKYKIKLVE